MTERTYGANYDRDRSVKDDAAKIRRTIKDMVKGGHLPADWKYSVRYRTASMMQAIDVHCTSPRPTLSVDPYSLNPDTGREIGFANAETSEARTVRESLTELVASFNHDGSDLQTDYFDVKFYGDVSVRPADGVPRFGG